jgi:hypothetical protein
MRKLTHLFAAAAIAGLASMTSASSASPIGAGLSDLNAVPSVASDDLVQKVHRWHCRKRYGWYRGHKYWHRHRRACYDDDYYYDDHYGAYPFYGVPFFSFQFFDDDDHHFRRHRHFRRHKHRRHHRKKWKHYY